MFQKIYRYFYWNILSQDKKQFYKIEIYKVCVNTVTILENIVYCLFVMIGFGYFLCKKTYVNDLTFFWVISMSTTLWSIIANTVFIIISQVTRCFRIVVVLLLFGSKCFNVRGDFSWKWGKLSWKRFNFWRKLTEVII